MARAMPKENGAAESLETRLDGGERLGQAQLVSLLRAIGDELADAHRAGRCHGTLTPADIGFDAAGEVEIGGWNRDTTPDPMRASRYAPIECYAPVHPQGPWTDVYSLGAILWRAITGEPPAEVLHRKGEVTLARLSPPGFDPAFLSAVDAALEIAPQRRPQSIGQWLALFPGPARALAGGTTVHAASAVGMAEATAPAGAVVAPARRRPWPLAAAAALVAVIGALWRGASPEVDPEPPRPTPAAPPQAAVKTPAPAPAPAPAVVQPHATTATVATEAARPAGAIVTAAPPKPEPPKAEPPKPQAAKPTPAPRVPPKVVARAPEPAPPVVVDARPRVFEPDGGEAPRALLVRADKRLRQLFGDYARMRARVERSYDDPDIPYEMKRWAYREGRRIQVELVELRDVRNRIARTGNFQTANRRFDDFEAAAAQLDARMNDVRRSF